MGSGEKGILSGTGSRIRVGPMQKAREERHMSVLAGLRRWRGLSVVEVLLSSRVRRRRRARALRLVRGLAPPRIPVRHRCFWMQAGAGVGVAEAVWARRREQMTETELGGKIGQRVSMTQTELGTKVRIGTAFSFESVGDRPRLIPIADAHFADAHFVSC